MIAGLGGVYAHSSGGWRWMCSACAFAAPAASRDAARAAYKAHRAELHAGAAPVKAKVAPKKVKAAAKAASVKAKAAPKKAKAAQKAPRVREPAPPVVAPGAAEAEQVFIKLLSDADTLEHAWGRVRQAFPRDPWGKVRAVTRMLTPHKTFAAAFKALKG